jgi:hypothetical protein
MASSNLSTSNLAGHLLDRCLFGRVKGKRLLDLHFQAESLKQRAFRDEVQQTLDSTWGTGQTSYLEVICQYDCKQQAGT